MIAPIFPPTREGESKTRFCERCGQEYKVASRLQKYCSKKCKMAVQHENERKRKNEQKQA